MFPGQPWGAVGLGNEFTAPWKGRRHAPEDGDSRDTEVTQQPCLQDTASLACLVSLFAERVGLGPRSGRCVRSQGWGTLGRWNHVGSLSDTHRQRRCKAGI